MSDPRRGECLPGLPVELFEGNHPAATSVRPLPRVRGRAGEGRGGGAQ